MKHYSSTFPNTKYLYRKLSGPEGAGGVPENQYEQVLQIIRNLPSVEFQEGWDKIKTLSAQNQRCVVWGVQNHKGETADCLMKDGKTFLHVLPHEWDKNKENEAFLGALVNYLA